MAGASDTLSGRLAVRLAALIMVGPLAFARCGPPPEAAPPTVVEQSLEIAEVFETLEPYSNRTVDSLDLGTFFEEHAEYRADSAEVVAFYQRREMQFAWVLRDSLSASAEAFIALIGAADQAASPSPGNAPELGTVLAAAYDTSAAHGQRVALCPDCATDVELLLTAEFFRFADRNYNGYFSRDVGDLGWFLPRTKKDPARLLDSLAVGGMDMSAYEPIHPQYQLLKSHLAALRGLTDEPWPALSLSPGTRTLELGDSADVVAAVRERLLMLGDLGAMGGAGAATGGAAARLDETLARAIERFQARHGLLVDGVIGPNTLLKLNITPDERIRTMLVNMERLRWVPEEQPENLLLVNIPEFRLHAYEGGEEVMTMDVVVGSLASRTVIFSDSVSSVVFSPTWTVPASITRSEILPGLARDPDYLADRNMEIIGGTDALPVIRQRPGPDNALGRVKFLFPNSYAIYMHDTPAQSHFGREERAFSHGCIRLSRPRDLALYLLRNDPEWPADRIDHAMASGTETFATLDDPVPVAIVYFTAWVDADGILNFRQDVYGHDARLANELFAGAPSG